MGKNIPSILCMRRVNKYLEVFFGN